MKYKIILRGIQKLYLFERVKLIKSNLLMKFKISNDKVDKFYDKIWLVKGWNAIIFSWNSTVQMMKSTSSKFRT